MSCSPYTIHGHWMGKLVRANRGSKEIPNWVEGKVTEVVTSSVMTVRDQASVHHLVHIEGATVLEPTVAASLDLTKPIQTRDGRPVRILCTDAQTPKFGGRVRPVIGLARNPTGEDSLLWWREDGTHDACTNYDLVNVPPPKVEETRQVWLLRCRANGSVTVHVAGKYDTNEPNTTRNEILARQTITLTEGEGL